MTVHQKTNIFWIRNAETGLELCNKIPAFLLNAETELELRNKTPVFLLNAETELELCNKNAKTGFKTHTCDFV